MNSFVKWGGFTGVMVLTIAWLGGAFHPKIAPATVETKGQTVGGVEIYKVKKEYIPIKEYYAGTVIAKNTARLSTRIAGFVEKIYVDVGDTVKKGQLLMVIDPKDLLAQKESLKHQIEATKAQLWAVKRTYDRLKALAEVDAVTPHQLDMVKAQYKALQNAVKALESALKQIDNNLKYAKIKAPFDGRISMKPVNEGDFVGPGSFLMAIDQPPYEVMVFLPERLFNEVQIGQNAEVSINGKKVEGKIIRKAPMVDPASRSFMVKISLPQDKKLVSGKSVYVGITLNKKHKAILIPKSAIFKWGDFTAVYVIQPDGVIRLRFVRLGLSYGDKVEVLSGLKEGEIIISKGINKACDGCVLIAKP